MRSEIRTSIAALAAVVVLMASATMALAVDGDDVPPGPTPTATASPSPTATAPSPSPSPSESTPTPEPTPTTPPTARTVTDAQLRWGVNNESNNKAFAPGTFNFFSAGKIGNPESGGKLLNVSDQGATWNNGKSAGWSAKADNVSIEKYLNGSWTPATFAGLRTNSSGTTMNGSNGFSNHELVISGGTGTVDRTESTASIQWTGSFTVIYYSGYSFFYVTDPKLTVSGGTGTLTATLGGYGSSMDDLDKWEQVVPVPDVVLAKLPGVELGSGPGFSATPAYSKIAVSLPANQTPQVTDSNTNPDWGSFPQSFIDFQIASGTGSYWYSSGGATDKHKAALPVTVSYSAADPVKIPTPSIKGSKTPKVDNDTRRAPKTSTDNPPSAPGIVPAPSTLPVPAPALGDPVQSASVLTQFKPVSTVTGIQAPPRESSDTTGIWILGGVLLGATLLVAASPFAYTAIRRTT